MSKSASAIPTYIIHLERAAERQVQVTAISNAVPGSTEIVPAVDGKAIPADLVSNVYAHGLFKPNYPFDLKLGEVGCFLSHRRCWQKIVDSQDDGALIIEDDVLVDGTWLASAIDLILQNCSSSAYVRFPNKAGRESGPVVARHKGIELIAPTTPGLGTIGQYVGRDAARNLLAITEKFDRPIDSFLQLRRIHEIPVFSVVPSKMRDVSSTIGQSHIQRTGSSILEKMHRETMRPIYRMQVRWNNWF